MFLLYASSLLLGRARIQFLVGFTQTPVFQRQTLNTPPATASYTRLRHVGGGGVGGGEKSEWGPSSGLVHIAAEDALVQNRARPFEALQRVVTCEREHIATKV